MDKAPLTYKTISDLPKVIPVFPLTGVLLLPRGQLPLNIFEPCYLAMVDEALITDRLIGMVQPKDPGGGDGVPLFKTGCVGKITDFAETGDGRYLITLTGVCRFDIEKEIEMKRGFRQVVPDWKPYENDTQETGCLDMDRDHLCSLLQNYFEQKELSCDWDMIDGVSDEKLITCLSMICPLSAGEKQALLEEKCCFARSKLFLAMLEMAVHEGENDCCGHH